MVAYANRMAKRCTFATVRQHAQAIAQYSLLLTYNENHSHMWPAWQPLSFRNPVLAHYYQELLNFCWRSLRNREAAADLVQESYARVLGAQQGSAPGPIREPRALLYHTARNLMIDSHRRASVRQHEAFDELPETAQPVAPAHLQPEQALSASQDWSACVAAIDALPPRCRDALVLHLFEELPQAQIAARMGISVSMVEKHIARGMLACQAQLQSLREGP